MVKMASDYNVKRCTLVIEIECGGSYGTNQVIKERNAFIFSLYTQEMGIEGIKGRCYLNVRIMVSLFA